MEGSPPTPLAPDLFRALELEPGPEVVPAAVEEEIDDRSTRPVLVGAPAAPKPVSRDRSGLADLLEPSAAAGPLSAGEPSADEEVPARSVPWLWIVLVLLLVGALGWVLLTQTDLRFGDVIAKREADAVAAAEQEKQQIAQEVEATRKEYGTVSVQSEPGGAGVWLVKPGPAASFENLPRAHEYLLWVDAPGRLPQIRRLKGTELGGKLVVDLDPGEDPERELPPPEAEPPAIAAEPDLEDTATLSVESPDPRVRFGLLVGYTPGVRVLDLDAAQTHELVVHKPGFLPHAIVIKGRHWEEAGEELVYSETVTLEPSPPEPTEPDGELSPEEDAAAAQAPPEPVPSPAAAAEASAAPKKQKKKKKKKKKR